MGCLDCKYFYGEISKTTVCEPRISMVRSPSALRLGLTEGPYMRACRERLVAQGHEYAGPAVQIPSSHGNLGIGIGI